MTAYAPGKVVLAGEYAARETATALVASVGRFASARVAAVASEPESPEVTAARLRANAAFRAAVGHVTVDTTGFRERGRKLGFGSSAAAAVATVAEVSCHGAPDLARGRSTDRAAEEAWRYRVFREALDAHRAVAPRGSGIDVCAATFGGVRLFRRADPKDANLVITGPFTIHPAISIVVVSVGAPARTSDLLEAVDALAERDRASYEEAIAMITSAAARMIEHLADGRVDELVLATRDHCQALHDLGVRSGVEIVTEEHFRIARIARDHGGAAKPSGAGGGDIAVAFFGDPERARSFGDACRAAGFSPTPVDIGVDGVKVGEAP